MGKIISCDQYSKRQLTAEIWREIKSYVAEAAKYAHNEFTPEDVHQSILKGDQQAWIVRENGNTKFVWITEILQQSERRVVVVMAASGDMVYGWEFWPWMSQWMQGNMIDEAEVYCRPSMARLLKKHGLKTRFEVLTIKPYEGHYVQ